MKHNGAARVGVARHKAPRLVEDHLRETPLRPVMVVVRWGQGILVRSHSQFAPVQVAQATETRGLAKAVQREEGTLMRHMPLT